MDGVQYCVLEFLSILQFFTITRQEETVRTAEFRLDLCQTGVKPGSALVEHKISASSARPCICALMSARSSFMAEMVAVVEAVGNRRVW